MPLLGGLFVQLFTGLVAWLTTWFTRKVAFAVAAVTAYSALTLGLYVVFRSTISTLNDGTAGLPAMFAMGMSWAVPPVVPACLGAYVTMWTACTVYTWQRDLLHLAVKA